MKTPETDYFPEIRKEKDLYLPLHELFKRIYRTDKVYLTDKMREEEHGCDIILEIHNLCRIGFQIKRTAFTRTTLNTKFKTNVQDAARFEFGIGNIEKLSQFIWVTTKSTNPAIGRPDIEKITGDLRFSKKVEIWDGKTLYENFLTHYPEAFTNIKLDSLSRDADEQSERGNHIFAAHYLFRVFILRLLQSEVDVAKEVIRKAIAEIELQPNKSVYLYRTLKRFYELWLLVTEMKGFDVLVERYKDLPKYKKQSDEYGKTWHECVFLMQLVNKNEVKEHLESLGMESSLCDYNFLCDFQYIFSQLQILFHEYADSPGGLSSKQICRTLMRFGFPPTGKIADRISRMKEELAAEHHRSVDSECSLCTGTVLSCLVLAREDGEIIKPVKDWLETLDDYRYTHENKGRYPDATSTEHGLHYAAPVLDAFVDYGDSENSGRVLQHYFGPDVVGQDGFYVEWMTHRNISSLEACAYIFSAFHRYLISRNDDFPFDKSQVTFLRKAIVNLVEVLRRETAPKSTPSRLYATRENIQSFCLGLLIGEKEPTMGLLREVMQNLHRRAIRIRKHDGLGNPFKRSLMDSNVDRTTRFIEGWISYWETIFYLVDDAPRFGANGAKLRKTVKELKDEGYLPNYNPN